MQSISDRMSSHIHELTNMKSNMLRNGSLVANAIKNRLESISEVKNVEVSDNGDRLYVSIEEGYEPSINKLDQPLYHKLMYNTIDKTIRDGLGFSYNMLGHISILPNKNMVIINI